MASLLTPQETLGLAVAGSISRLGAKTTTRTLNQAAGVAEGLLLAPSGTAGQECISPTTAAMVRAAVGFSIFRPMSEDFDSTHHYADNEAVALMEGGHMNVLAEGTVVGDAPVYGRFTSDGGSNTVLGKVRANSDGTVVIDTTSTVEGVYRVTLFNGVVEETFSYQTDGSAAANEITTGLVAAIDASANYAAAGTTECTITLVVGTEITIRQLAGPTAAAEALYTVVDNQKAARIPGCYFDHSRTGAGLVELRLNKQN
ncbi:MAG: hypothetical protein RL685_4448 [Pseudomonadota bacterium]|jgi:hypothetical protein